MCNQDARFPPATIVASALVWCLVFWVSVGRLPADEATSKYLAGLRARRLFSVAEGYCLAQRSRADLTPGRRALLTLELSRTFVDHAKQTAGDEQTDLWNRAGEVIDEFLQKEPRNSRRVLLEVQRAVVPVAVGEFLRWQTELFPYDEPLKSRARSNLDKAIGQLEELEKRIASRLRTAMKRRTADPGTLRPFELRALQHNVRFHLAVALLNRGKLETRASADRVATLMRAEEWFRRLAGGPPDGKRTWDSRVLLAETTRLLGDRKRAARQLASIEKDRPPRRVLDAVVAQRADLLLDEGQSADAAELLIKYRTVRGSLPGELRFIKAKAFLSLWEIAAGKNDQILADELLERIEAHVDRADREIGGFWGYRCRLLMGFARETQQYGGDLAPLIRKAKATYVQGKTEEAVDQYGEAAVAAHRAGRNELAMELGYTRASILLSAKQYDKAATAFRELAEQFPESQRAAAAHLLFTWSLGRLYDQGRTKSRRIAYAGALTAHREQFADDPTAFDATWMLAQLEESRRQTTEALTLYLQVPAGHTRGPDAQVAAARCYESILERLRELEQPAGEWETEAINRLAAYVSAFPPKPRALSLQQAEVSLRLARIYLNRARPGHTNAERLLGRVFSSEKSPKAGALSVSETAKQSATATAWKPLFNTATQLRIVSLAGRLQFDEAEELLRELSNSSPREVLSILDGLTQIAAASGKESRRGLGELQLQAADRLQQRRSELNPNDQQRLDRCRAEAYAATNQPRQAIKVYEGLLAERPRDKPLLKTVAQLLVECETRDCLQKAKSNWRTLESLEKPGSRDWLTARYQVAWCCFALEQQDECRKLLGVTRLLYPELGGGKLRSQFSRLENQLTLKPRR